MDDNINMNKNMDDNINLNKNMDDNINLNKNLNDNKKSITYFACHFPSLEGYVRLSNYKIFRKLFSLNIFNDK